MNTRQTIRNRDDLGMDQYQRLELEMECDRERETALILDRYAIRGEPEPRLHRHQRRATGADPRRGDTGVRGTPYPGEVTRHSVTGFKHLVERARALRLSQEPSVSPPVCQSPSSDSGHSVPASPTRPTIQGRRRLPALPPTTRMDHPRTTRLHTRSAGTRARARARAQPRRQPTTQQES